MKASSLFVIQLLLSVVSCDKFCLDVQGRYAPNIYLEQTGLVTYSPFKASMSATYTPKTFNGTFNVGSYNVPRSMGIDTDSPYTIV